MELAGISPFTNKLIELSIEGGEITKNILTTLPDDKEKYLSPGIIDIQVNGYGGADYSSSSISYEQIISIVNSLAKKGITRHFPTIITSPQQQMLWALERIRDAKAKNLLLDAAIPGIHIEGPYISAYDGPRGAHDATYVRDPDLSEFNEWQDASGGLISIVTIAPERQGAIEFIEEITNSGVIAAIGHTAASPEQIISAVKAGAKLSTHLCNGCATTIPRLRNFLWPQLAEQKLFASIIADGHHLPDEVLQVIHYAKGLERIILISDAAPLAGFAKGKYQWGNIEVEVFDDGHVGLPGTEILAGAMNLLNKNIVHYSRTTNISIGDALKLCCENPKHLLNIHHPSVEMLPGEPAHIIQYRSNEQSNHLEILRTVINGDTVFDLNINN